MPETVTISKVGATRTFETQNGKFVSYKLELEGHGPAELVQKPETPAPVVGQSVFGDLVPGKEGFPPKLKKAKQQGNYKPRDPAEIRAIQRQHSQEQALRFIANSGGFETKSLASKNVRENLALTEKLADWFDKDIANGKAG